MRVAYNKYSRRFDFSAPPTFVPVLLACIACWVVSYLYSVGYPVYGEVSATPLWNTICQTLPGKEFTYIIGMTLMFGGAFLLHRANYVLVLIREKTMLPFLFYVLFISTNPDFFPLKSTSVGVFCLILAIYQLFTTYHDPGAREKAYSAALLIGIGSLLWVHLLWFLPLFWLGMYNFRSLTSRTFIASLLGVATVYWFLLGWCVWQRDFTLFNVPFSTLFKVRLLATDGIVLLDWISIMAIALLTVVAYGDTWQDRVLVVFYNCGSPGCHSIHSYMEFLIEYGYIGVFIASFLAATVLPFSSEVVLTGVLLAGAAYWPCMIAATLGNFLGGMSCYWLGMLGKVEWIEKYLKLDAVKLQKVQDWIKGKGSWMGFFVFLPGIGDFIAVALGFLRANIWIVAVSMFLGKAIRYWVWMEFVYKVQGMF